MCSMILLLENPLTFIILLFIPDIHPSFSPLILFILFKAFYWEIESIHEVEKTATELPCAHHPASTFVTIPLFFLIYPSPTLFCFCLEHIKTNLRKYDFTLKYFSMKINF